MARSSSAFLPTDQLNREHIEKAVKAIREGSLDATREELGANHAQKYFLVDGEHEYDAKLIIHLAWNLAFPDSLIAANDFRGDARHVAHPLRAFGFDIIERDPKRVIGEIAGVRPGSTFENRIALSKSGVHRPRQAGICGNGTTGAESIVVSGGYVDDEDLGHTITYTGHGGNDPTSGRQIADQELSRGNLALAYSCDQRLPVRVVRGAGGDPNHSPRHGYRYDGLFWVLRYWPDTGRDGFRIWRFELSKILDQQNGTPAADASGGLGTAGPAPRRALSGLVVARNPRLADWVKRVHDWTCQFCRERIETPAGAYAEAAHIRPLGSPHHGSDHTSNMLCLCPNCHKRFDSLSRHVSVDGMVVDTATQTSLGALRTHPNHRLDMENLAFHRHLCRLLIEPTN